MALEHWDTTLSKIANMERKLVFSSVYCHINAPFSTKIMRKKVNLTYVYVISMFLLFSEHKFSCLLLIIRALKGADSSERNSVSSELERKVLSTPNAIIAA
jgi:hypothetical protein